jgi:hypothetical protein
MSTVEDQLSRLLQDHAETVDPSATLLRGALGRSKQRRRRNLGAGLLTVTAVVALVSMAATLVSTGGSRRADVSSPSIVLVHAPPLEGTFPYTATYLPPGTDRNGSFHLWNFIEKDVASGPTATAQWDSPGRQAGQWLLLNLAGAAPEATGMSPFSTTVRGHVAHGFDAGTYSFEGGPEIHGGRLFWQEGPGQVLTLSYDADHITLAEVRAFANGLTLKDDTRASWVTMTTSFKGGELGLWSKGSVILAPAPLDPNGDLTLSVSGCLRDTFIPTDNMTQQQLGEHSYLVEHEGVATQVIKQVDPDTDLVVDFHGTAWTEADMGRILDGLGWTGPTPAAPTSPNTC